MQLVTAFKANPMDWLAAGGMKLSGHEGQHHQQSADLGTFIIQKQFYMKLVAGRMVEINIMLR